MFNVHMFGLCPSQSQQLRSLHQNHSWKLRNLLPNYSWKLRNLPPKYSWKLRNLPPNQHPPLRYLVICISKVDFTWILRSNNSLTRGFWRRNWIIKPKYNWDFECRQVKVPIVQKNTTASKKTEKAVSKPSPGDSLL